MNEQQDKMWSAYLDGELSAAEAAEFDAALNATTQRRLQGEVTFEHALSEKLRAGVACPDALWAEVRGRLDSRAPMRRLRRWSVPLAIAASLVLGAVFAAQWFQQPEFLQPIESMADVRSAHWDGTTTEEVGMLLHDLDLHVQVWPTSTLSDRHTRGAELVGARELTYRHEPVVQVVYECCGKPVALWFAREGTPAARAMHRAARHPTRALGATRSVGNAVVAPVGNHRTTHLADVVSAVEGSV